MTDLQRAGAPSEQEKLGEWIGQLLNRNVGPKDPLQAVKQFGGAVKAQVRDLSRITDQGAEILANAVNHLPIRTPDSLRAAYGSNDEAVAAGVVDDAAALAGWLWTAAAAVPGPPPVVHAVKVIGHSAIAIRMVGELHGPYGEPDWQRDGLWLNAVLTTWAAGWPTAVGGVSVSGARDITTKIRQAFVDLVSTESRATNVSRRGREGSDALRRLGGQMQRRMRLHPQMWERAGATSAMAAVRQTVTSVVNERIPLPGRAADPDVGPRALLREAWAQHQLAQSAASATVTADAGVVLARLQSALVAQDNHLRSLSRALGDAPPAVAPPGAPGPRQTVERGDPLSLANQYAWDADDAIGRTELAAARPRRLASWAPRRRNALVYGLTGIVLSAPIAVATTVGWVTSWGGVLALLLVQALVLPWVTLLSGRFLVGRLYRPYLGGHVARSVVVGALLASVVHAFIAVVLGILALVCED